MLLGSKTCKSWGSREVSRERDKPCHLQEGGVEVWGEQDLGGDSTLIPCFQNVPEHSWGVLWAQTLNLHQSGWW